MHPMIQELIDEQQARTAWRVTHDYLVEEYGGPSAVGVQSVGFEAVVAALPKGAKLTRFRLYDDDGVLYYAGDLYDDPDAESQSAALMWAASDSGCTAIKVFKGRRWIEEIC